MLELGFLMLNITGMLIGYGHNFIEIMLPNGTIMIFRTPQALQIATEVPLAQNVSVIVNGTKLMLQYRHRYKHKYMINATVSQVEEMIGNRTVCLSCKEMRERMMEMHKYRHEHKCEMCNETMTHTMTHVMKGGEKHKEAHETVTTVAKEVTQSMGQRHKEERRGHK